MCCRQCSRDMGTPAWSPYRVGSMEPAASRVDLSQELPEFMPEASEVGDGQVVALQSFCPSGLNDLTTSVAYVFPCSDVFEADLEDKDKERTDHGNIIKDCQKDWVLTLLRTWTGSWHRGFRVFCLPTRSLAIDC
eukprot:1343039-Amphidinium_carterae.1